MTVEEQYIILENILYELGYDDEKILAFRRTFFERLILRLGKTTLMIFPVTQQAAFFDLLKKSETIPEDINAFFKRNNISQTTVSLLDKEFTMLLEETKQNILKVVTESQKKIIEEKFNSA